MTLCKCDLQDAKKKVSELEEERRAQTQEARKLQNATESEAKKERDMLREKNNALNKEITRLSMMMSTADSDSNKFDKMTADRIHQLEDEIESVSQDFIN